MLRRGSRLVGGQEPLSITGAGKVLESFPPGSQISYAPESRNEADFNSVILGYEVNAQYYFHKNDLQYDEEAQALVGIVDGEAQRITSLQSLHMIIPHTPQDGDKLSYVNKARVGARIFVPGNLFRLKCVRTQNVYAIDTTLEKRTLLRSGPYTNFEACLLSVKLNSIAAVSRRKSPRMNIQVNCQLRLSDETTLDGFVLNVTKTHFLIRYSLPESNTKNPLFKVKESIELLLLDEQKQFYVPKTLVGAEIAALREDDCILVEIKSLSVAGMQNAYGELEMAQLRAAIIELDLSRAN